MIMSNSAASYVAMQFGCKGPGFSLATACASGTNAIGEAAAYIRDGRADSVICGGSDATINVGMMHAWNRLRITSRRNDTPEEASRPFSKDRDGIVLGEGAGMLVVEELEQAKARGAHIYAEIIGYGSSYDATHMTAPDLEGQSLSMERALADASLTPGRHRLHQRARHRNRGQRQDGNRRSQEGLRRAGHENAAEFHQVHARPYAGRGRSFRGRGLLPGHPRWYSAAHHQPARTRPRVRPGLRTQYGAQAKVDTIMSTSFGFGGNNAVLILRRV